MTSVNSVRASLVAHSSASFRACARRASDSIIRSSTTSCAHRSARSWVIEASKAITLDGMLTDGIGGSTQTWVEAETGIELVGGGSAEPALEKSQVATAGPAPTVSASWGV